MRSRERLVEALSICKNLIVASFGAIDIFKGYQDLHVYSMSVFCNFRASAISRNNRVSLVHCCFYTSMPSEVNAWN